MMSTTVQQPERHRFLSNSPPQSSTHLSCRISRCPNAGQSANWAIIGSLTSSSGCSTQECNGSACLCQQTPMGNRPFTTRPSTKSLRSGPMMDRSGRRLWPACGIWRPHNSSIPVCSMATGPTPWPKKGRWYWLLGPQTPERRQGHRYYRQPWLRLSPCPCGSCQ